MHDIRQQLQVRAAGNLETILMYCHMKKALLLVFAASPLSLLAHEGHGHVAGNNPLHYVAEPMHAMLLVIALLVVAAAVYAIKKQRNKS